MRYVRPRDLIATFEDDGKVLLKSTSRGAGARTPSWAVGVLAACHQPRTREEVMAAMGPAAGQLFDGLVDAGLLVSPEEAQATPTIFHNYAGVEVHRRMLGDEPRIRAYRQALEAVVRPGDVVIDAGSGTGVLATLAALAGAKKVYAVERTDMAAVIEHVARASGVGDKVQVVRADFGQVRLPEKARVLVSETYGHWAIAEGMMPDLAACARNNLTDDGVIIPGSTTLWLAPMPSAAEVFHPFRKREDGVDLSVLRHDVAGRGHDRIVAPSEVGEAICMGTLTMPTDGTYKGTLVLEEPCEALCGWFTLHMAPGIDLLTGPHDEPTHWEQTILPLSLDAGEYEVTAGPAPEDGRTLVVSVGGHEVRIR